MQLAKISLLFFTIGAMATHAAYSDDFDLLTFRDDCGPTAGPCNKNGCAGINNPSTGGGTCTANYRGCPCTSVCGQKNGPCNKNGCNGINGKCTAGGANGCYCDE